MGKILNQYQRESKLYEDNPILINFFFCSLELVESSNTSVKIVLFFTRKGFRIRITDILGFLSVIISALSRPGVIIYSLYRPSLSSDSE